MDRVKLLRRSDTKYLISKKRVSDLLPSLVRDYFILEIVGWYELLHTIRHI